MMKNLTTHIHGQFLNIHNQSVLEIVLWAEAIP